MTWGSKDCAVGSYAPIVLSGTPFTNKRGRDKMAAVSQTTLSNAFSWMKILEFRLRFHRCFTEVCSQGSNLQYSGIGSDNGLAPARSLRCSWSVAGRRCSSCILYYGRLQVVRKRPTFSWCIYSSSSLIARFMGPAWGSSGADRTQVGPMLAH